MDRQALVEAVRQQESELRRRGVVHAAIFGSHARNEGHADSDLDLMIDIDPLARFTIYDLVGVGHLLGDVLGLHVDVVERAGMKPAFRTRVERDALPVF